MAGRAREARIPSNSGTRDAANGTGRTIMDKHARRAFFERLCQLRDAYERLKPEDATGVIAVETMIARAEAALERRSSPLIAMLERGATGGDPRDN